ncbi:hypothetical protein [Pseudomonas wenzhouensis]|uniref:hypothetical protein n=1 Tax=Pseudomonas wenzhouensis TaxID=2906062 RepID=UPI001E4A530D|nr:hypothetical protein [Pseudomonas wenzhouensis]
MCQIHECNVELSCEQLDRDSLAALREAFHQRHKALFSYSEPDSPVELVNLECSVIARLQRPPLPELEIPAMACTAAPEGHRPMLFSADAPWQDTPVYNGDRLRAGQSILGPCVIEEATTNIVVPPGWRATLEPSATYRLTPGD